jgi:hypothetical protein
MQTLSGTFPEMLRQLLTPSLPRRDFPSRMQEPEEPVEAKLCSKVCELGIMLIQVDQFIINMALISYLNNFLRGCKVKDLLFMLFGSVTSRMPHNMHEI